MGRRPCCAKEGLNRGAWTAMEDKILTEYIRVNGEGKWRNLPQRAGLRRCGKSCRLRWLNYLKPGIRRGNITNDEEDLIIRLHKLLGNRWSIIAGRLPGRTDNEIKNYWNTNIVKKLGQAHPSPASNSRASQPAPVRIGSGVVRTKASRCTKVFFTPELQNATDHHHLFDPKPAVGGPTMNGSDCVGVAVDPNPVNDISPLISAKDNPSDSIMMDFEIDDKFLSDFLNPDFPSLCDENVKPNNTSLSSSPNSSTILFPTDSVKAEFLDELLDGSLLSITPFLGMEWLQDLK